jgi:hypothetical protein
MNCVGGHSRLVQSTGVCTFRVNGHLAPPRRMDYPGDLLSVDFLSVPCYRYWAVEFVKSYRVKKQFTWGVLVG